jgi:hypothetical protein
VKFQNQKGNYHVKTSSDKYFLLLKSPPVSYIVPPVLVRLTWVSLVNCRSVCGWLYRLKIPRVSHRKLAIGQYNVASVETIELFAIGSLTSSAQGLFLVEAGF